jgi:zinc protease
MLLGLPASLQGTGVGYFYSHVRDYGLPDDYWNGYIQRIRALKPTEIAAAAKRLYAPTEATWFVVGDLSKIEADVRKLNLGEVMVYDADGRRVR